MLFTVPKRASGRRERVVSVRRSVNESVANLAMWRGEEDDVWEFVCECGDPNCWVPVRMTVSEFWATGAGLVVGHRVAPLREVKVAPVRD